MYAENSSKEVMIKSYPSKPIKMFFLTKSATPISFIEDKFTKTLKVLLII